MLHSSKEENSFSHTSNKHKAGHVKILKAKRETWFNFIIPLYADRIINYEPFILVTFFTLPTQISVGGLCNTLTE